MLLGEAVKMVGQYYDISVSDTALGQLDSARVLFIRDNCRFTHMNPDGNSVRTFSLSLDILTVLDSQRTPYVITILQSPVLS